jgi:hypothetical protein
LGILERPAEHPGLRVLAVTQGQWGERIADHVGRFHPPSWAVHRWAAPRSLPLLIDEASEFLPPALPNVDLVLALGETTGVAQLIPDIVKLTGARAVIAPIDRNESLPAGLVAQLQRWLTELDVAVVFPKPFCSLTETATGVAYNQPPIVRQCDDATIRQFASAFGRPRFRAVVDSDRRIQTLLVEREAACGCARFVAQGLVGQSVDDAEYEAGMLHHHYPCLASMNQDPDYADTLMHVSGHISREAVRDALQAHVQPPPYLRPSGRVEV